MDLHQKHIATAAVGAVLIIAFVTGTFILRFWADTHTEDNDTQFYVLGDTQGYQGGLQQVVETANLLLPDFVFHVGDLTPFGQYAQYEDVQTVLDSLAVPFHTTPGNHDIRVGGTKWFRERFGPANYSFDVGECHFTVINSSAGDIDQGEMMWLETDLAVSRANWKFVFTHMPLFDPYPEQEHSLLNATTALRVIEIMESYDVDAVFAGHIHIFNMTERNGVKYVVTGGAGVSLYADALHGGLYHFLNVTVNEEHLSIEAVSLSSPHIERDRVNILTLDDGITLSFEDLMTLPRFEGFSSFQNQLGNWRGQGTYDGVTVSDLLSLVGGMSTDCVLRVAAEDGYEQLFSHSNVYPNATWRYIQGDMVLAFSYNETSVPDWEDGLRFVMIPADGAYSNDDCLATSEPGQGFYVYDSAGARWVRYVSIIEVIPK